MTIQHPARAPSLLAALLVSTSIAGADAAGAERLRLGIDVAATGAHPSGMTWDGRRIFYLPVEASTVSPPDIEVCIVEAGGVGCASGGDGSRCPDAERCRFEDLAIDPARVFGVLVFDYDGLGAQVVDQLAGSARDVSDAVSRLPGHWALGDFGEDARAVTERLADGIGRASDGAAALNGRRLEWMDALVIVPDADEVPTEALAAVSTRMRDFVRSVAPPGSDLLGALSRLDGPFETRRFGDCAWPSPPCHLSYVTVQISEEE